MRNAWMLVLLSLAAGCDSGESGGAQDAARTADGAAAGGAGGAGGGAGGAGGGAGGVGGGAADAGLGCMTSEDCTGDRIFCNAEGRCVGCVGDSDCAGGTVCEAELCVPGCRADAGCGAGLICEAEACVAGCRTDAACEAGQICEGDACVAGCRDQAGCPADQVCFELTCTEGCANDAACGIGRICQTDGPVGACADGCRADAGCLEGSLCISETCIARGVGCHGDGDCGEGDRCDTDTARCVPEAEMCPPDAAEPDDRAAAPIRDAGRYGDLRICPGDADWSALALQAGDQVDIRVEFARANGDLEAVVTAMDAEVARGVPDEGGLRVTFEAGATLPHLLVIRGVDGTVRNAYVLTVGIAALPMCMDVQVFPDTDNDGFGVEAGAVQQCLNPDEASPGFARRAGDCGPNDPWRNPGAEEICRDYVDDDCNGSDVACPESRPGVQVPDWACDGTPPPANVVAFARFANGGGYFRDGGCFVFFEGHPGEFYVQRRLDRSRVDPSCDTINGCTCPSLNAWPAYDRRMYAFTTTADAAACAPLSIVDHGGEQQPVSNQCRKYLYQMHFYDIPFSYIAGSLESLRRRLALFPTVEVACVQDLPHANLPFQSLISAPVQFNDGYRPLP